MINALKGSDELLKTSGASTFFQHMMYDPSSSIDYALGLVSDAEETCPGNIYEHHEIHAADFLGNILYLASVRAITLNENTSVDSLIDELRKKVEEGDHKTPKGGMGYLIAHSVDSIKTILKAVTENYDKITEEHRKLSLEELDRIVDPKIIHEYQSLTIAMNITNDIIQKEKAKGDYEQEAAEVTERLLDMQGDEPEKLRETAIEHEAMQNFKACIDYLVDLNVIDFKKDTPVREVNDLLDRVRHNLKERAIIQEDFSLEHLSEPLPVDDD